MTIKNAIQDPLDTPVMRQYLEIKRQYPDTILFFRMGDFYELFLDDAKTAAPIMDVALTRRQGGVPMAGVPYHSADNYISRLINSGKKVAIAEQYSDPENPKLMKRIVRRVLSPGTLVEDTLLTTVLHNYLMAIIPGNDVQTFAVCDVSTGDFFSTQIEAGIEEIRNYFYRYNPGEILVPSNHLGMLREVLPDAQSRIVPQEDWKASPSEGIRRMEHKFKVNPAGLGYDGDSRIAPGAVSLILHYLEVSFPEGGLKLDAPVYVAPGKKHMQLDAQTIKNLDLVLNSRDSGTDHTLLDVLDFSCTNAGKRFLKDAILNPLLDENEIMDRLDVVAYLKENNDLRQKIRSSLSSVSDLDRILSRISSGRAAPRDFTGIVSTVNSSSDILSLLSGCSLESLRSAVVPDSAVLSLEDKISSSVRDELPAVFGNGPFLRDGVDDRLDKARDALIRGSEWILQFEEEERRKTGINTLKIKYNKVAGYFIEMSRIQAKDAPSEFRRKQTLVGNERFTCDRLQELENIITGAEEVIASVEEEFYKNLCEEIIAARESLRVLMQRIAFLDFLAALSEAAHLYGWVRPEITKYETAVINGRHPVVEKYLPPGEVFIPNNMLMDSQNRTFAIITGPNMAGKSTYIRQAGLLQLLMQMGSFVPAEICRMPVVDCIYTRIGASDDLTRGESTFYVEMLETARILNRLSERSLIIMDEVGRGTSTHDGLSIAWAVVEFLSGDAKKRPKTLFATHYHELTALDEREGVFNLTMDVHENDGHIVFLHRVKEGQADRSYGIHVAKLAGMPDDIITRAEEKLLELESGQKLQELNAIKDEIRKKRENKRKEGIQPDLF